MENSQLVSLIQNTNDHILNISQQIGRIEGWTRSTTEIVNNLKDRHDEMERKQNDIIKILTSKMDPDRCAFSHSDLEKRINDKINPDKCEKLHEELKKEIFKNTKESVKGWAKIVLNVLKVIAYTSLALGGGAWAAQALGLLKGI